MILFYYSITITTVGIALILYVIISMQRIKQLKDQPTITNEPALAIIVAVRNEEEDVEKALQSLCNINYNNHRIIVVNDRSTDRTGEILQRFNHLHLNIISLTELPDGWLGKNNALYQGYINSNEEWMLFTDADIEYHPDAISKAMGYAETNQLDHLSILPYTQSRSQLLNSALATFRIMLLLFTRPWDACKPNRSGSIGVGAFNLVRRTAYEQAGTHVKLKLRPDDDLKLGQNIKAAGLRQDVLNGDEYICLEWYKNLNQFIDGLMKNTFAVRNYNILWTIADVSFTLLSIALPIPIMLVFGDTNIRIMACLLLAVQFIYIILSPPNKWWHALMGPFAGLLMAYIMVRSAFITLKQGGIYWRDTFYSLATLKGK